MQKIDRQNKKGRRRGRWVLWLLATMLLVFGGFLALMAYVSGVGARGFIPPQMAAAYNTPQDLVGDLGGMPVRIDRHIVRLVEYDGDPGWGDARKGPPPERTHASRLASFGFYVRYPDMRSLNEPEMRADFERYHPIMKPMEYGLRDKDPWLNGGISSGNRYPGHGFLDRLYAALLDPTQQSTLGAYLPEPTPIKGLDLFIRSGNHPHNGTPMRYEAGNSDTYVHRTREGQVTTYIRCGYQSTTQRPTSCTQEWSMEEFDLNIVVEITYRHGLLPLWQDIQAKVSQFILDFKDPTVTASAPAAPAAQPQR